MKYLILLALLFTKFAAASDWNGNTAVIERMYIYSTYAIIKQGDVYAGTANCKPNNSWSFYWDDLTPDVRQRVYSAILAAYTSKTPIKPIFHDTECGPEGNKKFTGSFVFD